MGKIASRKEIDIGAFYTHKKNEDKFRQLIRNSFDMIVLMDANGIQHYVSESCENILGYKPNELTDIPVIDTMIHPDDREIVYEGFNGILTQSKHGGTQYRHRHKTAVGFIWKLSVPTSSIIP
jgi:two-component system, sensor histidine kinase and response regulator